MPILTARQLKDRDSPESLIDLGDGQQVLVRRPDMPTLLYAGVLPTPLISAVIRTISDWVGSKAEVTVDMLAGNEETRTLVDVWVCASLVRPKAVMDEKDRGDTDTLLISDLTLDTKAAIFNATFSFNSRPALAAREAAKRFPDDGPGAGAGPDVPEVPPAAVGGDRTH